MAVQKSAGRPRRNTKSRSGDTPRDEIIEAAARLFAEKGYTATTMSDIAREVGVHQSSVYYWFSRKEAILHEALMVVRAPVDFVQHVASEENPALKIYRLLHFDTLQMAQSNIDFLEIEIVATNYYDDFRRFWDDYADLHRVLAGLIEQAIAHGEFVACDPGQTALVMLSTNEGTQKRYRRQRNHDDPGHGFTYPALSAEEWAHLSATTSVRGLLKDPREVVKFREIVEAEPRA